MIDYCFNEKHIDVLWSDFFIDNPASGRVMEKCGFRETGEMRYCENLYGGSKRPVKVMKLEAKFLNKNPLTRPLGQALYF